MYIIYIYKRLQLLVRAFLLMFMNMGWCVCVCVCVCVRVCACVYIHIYTAHLGGSTMHRVLEGGCLGIELPDLPFT